MIGIGEEGITNENSTNRYRMFAHFGDNGELRVDDVAYEQSHEYLTDDEKEELTALYNFANNKKENAEDEPYDWNKSFNDKLKNSEPCPNNIYMGISENSGCYNGHLLYSQDSCINDTIGCHQITQMQEDENGNIIRISYTSYNCFLNKNAEITGYKYNPDDYSINNVGCTDTITKYCVKYENWEDADRGNPNYDVPCP